jgi:hypothetical protein
MASGLLVAHRLAPPFRLQKQESMRRVAADSPKVSRDKIEHPQMSPLHEMKTAENPVSDRSAQFTS